DYHDLSEIGAVLARLVLFDKARFLYRDTKNISSNLASTVEWFESRLLGQFDAAYDKNDLDEMRVNAYADYQLRGGLGCVQVFISKNPVFFDHTFNPSLLDSKLPTLTGPAMGYALADEFAKYMDHMLTNCIQQAKLVSQIFVPDISAMTLFMDKVFEDSISEYLTAVISSAKAKEGQMIYLHTLATAVYCCTQFITLIANNQFKVYVDQDSLRFRINEIFAPYVANFLDLELDQLRKRFKAEIDKWDNRKSKTKKAKADAEKAKAAQKNQLVSSMKAMVMAPVALLGGGARTKGASQPLLADMDENHVHNDTATYDTEDDSINSLIS
ncbi:F-box protein: endocytic membrane traffic, recycling ReCYcling 1, partial [Kappamyces sp. JEL0680]